MVDYNPTNPINNFIQPQDLYNQNNNGFIEQENYKRKKLDGNLPNIGTKLNTIQNMFFNNNVGGNLPYNNLFPNGNNLNENPNMVINNTNNGINRDFSLPYNLSYNNIPLQNLQDNNLGVIDIGYLNNFEDKTQNQNYDYNNPQVLQNQINSSTKNTKNPNYGVSPLNNNENFLGNNLLNLSNSNNSPGKNNNYNQLNQMNNPRPKQFSSVDRNEKIEENIKKKTLLENIQMQIINNKTAKINELEKKKLEDQKYLSGLNINNPFGRNGAGAPLRDNTGNIITKRRALISDNKIVNENEGSGNHLNNIINNLTQKISNEGNLNNRLSNTFSGPRYNSAKINSHNQNLILNKPNLNYQNLQTLYNNGFSNNNQINPGFNNINPQQNLLTNNINLDYNQVNPNNYYPNGIYNGNGNVYNIPNINGNNIGYQNQNDLNNLYGNNNQQGYPYNNNNNGNFPYEIQDNNNNIYNNQSNIGIIPVQNNNGLNNYMNNNQNLNNSLNLNNQPGGGNVNQSNGIFNTSINEKKKKGNDEYKKSLLEQIELRKIQKDNEKKIKHQLELDEEKRIERELELIKIRYDEENNGKKKKIEESQKNNIKLLEDFIKEDEKDKKNTLVSKKKKIVEFEPIQNPNNNNLNNINKSFGENFNNYPNQNNYQQGNPQIYDQENNYNPHNDNNYNNNNFNPQNQQNYPYNNNQQNNPYNNQQNYPFENKNNFNDKIFEDIQNLKNTFLENQNNLMNRIGELKQDSSNANLQNSETAKELSNLKHELENIRKDEEYRRKYLYDVLLDKNLKDKDKTEHFNNFNATKLSSLFGQTGDMLMNATSKFIDLQTKQIYSCLADFPNNNRNVKDHLNSTKNFFNNKENEKNEESLFYQMEERNINDINELNINLSNNVEKNKLKSFENIITTKSDFGLSQGEENVDSINFSNKINEKEIQLNNFDNISNISEVKKINSMILPKKEIKNSYSNENLNDKHSMYKMKNYNNNKNFYSKNNITEDFDNDSKSSIDRIHDKNLNRLKNLQNFNNDIDKNDEY